MNVSSFFNYTEPLSDSNQSSSTVDYDFRLLSGWPSHNWNTFLDLTQSLRFDKGDTVFDEGNSAHAIYVVAAGQFELLLPATQITGGAGPLQIATIDLGCVLGEQGLLDRQPNTFMARAVTEGELVCLPLAGYESLQARYPELATQLVMDLARIVSLRQRQTATLLGK